MRKIIIAVVIITMAGIAIVSNNYDKNKFLDIASNVQFVNNEVTTDMEVKKTDVGIKDENVKEIINRYPEFKNVINEGNVVLPIADDMVPQGITLMGDYILITSYDNLGKRNSIVHVLDKKGNLVNKVTLDNKSHVGGISYDKENNLIWLPDDDGVLLAYESEEFINKKNVKYKYKFNNVSDELKDFLNKDRKLIAFLTIDDGYIYIGNFSKDNKSIVKKYEIINNGEEILLKYMNKFKVPAKTQSITFKNIGNKKYMLTSNSYTRRKSSYIKVFEYKEEISDYEKEIKSIELPPMLEQIVVDDNNLYIIFESNAKKYSNCLEKIGYICVLDLYKIIKS